MKFLVVDDMATIRNIIVKLLRKLGYKDIQETVDGRKAIQLLRKGRFDFVITDWNMPNMPGIELLRLIRADPELSDLPVLMVTAEAKKQQVIEAAQAGIDDYISKPFSAKKLEEKILKILAKRGNST